MESAHLLSQWILCTLFICGSSINVSIKQERTLVDLSHARIITSPLKSGSNSTDLLVPDYSKPPHCVITIPHGISWILIDIGYPVSGLSQIRLFTDTFVDNSHDFLAHIEVTLAEYLPQSALDRFIPDKSSHFNQCDSTGTVSKDTSNAVIDCVTPTTARWVLLRKIGQLNLCFVQFLQNTVKPDCFHRVSGGDTLFQRAKESLSVFRSLNFVRFLDCLRDCDKEANCEAVAFIWHRGGSGMCQLLRYKESSGDFLCDDSCELRINQCHIGEKLKILSQGEDDSLRLPWIADSSYALSVEVNGEALCGQDECGRTSMWIRDNNGTLYYCGTIDSRIYRILIHSVFLCLVPVKDPKYLMLKYDPIVRSRSVKFTSIHVRVAKEGSLFLYNVSGNNIKSSTTISITTANGPSTVSMTLSDELRSSLSSQSSVSSSASPGTGYEESAREDNNERGINEIGKDSITKNARWNMERRTKQTKLHQSTAKDTILTHPDTLEQDISKKKTKRIIALVKTTEATTLLKENTSFVLGRTKFEGKNVPFLWLILLIFGFILVIVTMVVVLVTFVEGRRKRKHWSIPAGGLFPPDCGSESVTMATSLQMSTTR